MGISAWNSASVATTIMSTGALSKSSNLVKSRLSGKSKGLPMSHHVLVEVAKCSYLCLGVIGQAANQAPSTMIPHQTNLLRFHGSSSSCEEG